MKRTKLLLLWLSFIYIGQQASAQVTDNFNDGNFTANPAWTGNTADWTVNSNLQLQSNNTVANASFYLSTPNTLSTQTQWDFFVRLNLSTSGLNYADVFLTASASDLTLNATTGYFVRIGNTDDEIALYRKDAAGATTKIIDGVNGTTNSSDNIFKIRVIRDAANRFTLFRDAGPSGTFVSEGSVVDATYTASSFFGILIRQSTATFFQRHYFDDIAIQPYSPDVTPPAIQSAAATSINTVDILFSEPVNGGTAQNVANYSVNNGIGNPQSAQIDGSNNALVHLTFAAAFPSGATNTITINGVQDVAGNAISNGTATFSFFTAGRFDVVIDEIMADPTPVVGLPNAEYIEIKNVSGRDINLQGWRLTSSSTTSGAFPAYILPADSFLTIASTTNAALFAGRTLGISSFPALDNDGTLLTLLSREGRTVHAVNYSSGWYANPAKGDGGWSLEMIDTRNPCMGSNNWKASNDASGGTPGRKNSVDGTNNDQTPPAITNAYLADNTTIIIAFDEPVDSASGATVANYVLSPSITITSVTTLAPTFTQVQLKLATTLTAQTIYTITVTNVADCKGNKISTRNKAQLGTPVDAAVNDVVINEILFNPRPNAFDYVEFYNRSNKIVDASKLLIANRNSSGVAGSIRKLSETPFYLFPGEYVVVTEEPISLGTNYLVQNPAAVLTVSSMPSFTDNEGTVVLLNLQGTVIDEVHYLDDWHFGLLSDEEGISLERIDPDGISQDKNNWHSAASTAGYGTPGYKNSQYKRVDSVNAAITISPAVFSPDNDGFNDIATLQYKVDGTGFVANITIFDAAGRLVRHLVKNQTLALSGSWAWDGLGEKGQRLPIGHYIIYTEFFNLRGKKERFKNTIVLARRLN
jgi:hypothetical protein